MGCFLDDLLEKLVQNLDNTEKAKEIVEQIREACIECNRRWMATMMYSSN